MLVMTCMRKQCYHFEAALHLENALAVKHTATRAGCILDVDVQDEEVIEDWELWGDPREVERRKADRRRAAQPLHVRQAQVCLPCPWPHLRTFDAAQPGNNATQIAMFASLLLRLSDCHIQPRPLKQGPRWETSSWGLYILTGTAQLHWCCLTCPGLLHLMHYSTVDCLSCCDFEDTQYHLSRLGAAHASHLALCRCHQSGRKPRVKHHRPKLQETRTSRRA